MRGARREAADSLVRRLEAGLNGLHDSLESLIGDAEPVGRVLALAPCVGGFPLGFRASC